MKVRCIDVGHPSNGLVLGGIYEIENGVLLGMPSGSVVYDASFEPVTDEPDKAACPKCGDDVGYSAEYAHCMGCGATDKDLLNLAFPCPGIDPDDRRYAAEDDSATAALMALRDRASGATARLRAGLESEKARERVKPLPHPARNPR